MSVMASLNDPGSALCVLQNMPIGEWPAWLVHKSNGERLDCTPVGVTFLYRSGPFDGLEVIGHLPRYAFGEVITEDAIDLNGNDWRYECELCSEATCVIDMCGALVMER